MKEGKKLYVSAIKNGTVIDHIPSESLFKVINILSLDKIEEQITFGTNLDSKKQGKKAIIKISNTFFKEDDINKIALIAPDAKLNIIKNYKVVEKWKVKVPEKIIGIVKCFNPKCITNHEIITTHFTCLSDKPITLKCLYCEKITEQENIKMV